MTLPDFALWVRWAKKKKAIQCVCSNKMYQTLVYVPVCLIK